jgi:hypothetical protein
MIKTALKWAGQIECFGEKRNAYRVLAKYRKEDVTWEN